MIIFQEFEAREKSHRKALVDLGIDPDFVPVIEGPDEEEPRAASTLKTTTSSSGGGRTGDGSRAATPAMFCDYCGGKDHPEADCPHRLKDVESSSSESEEEDSGNESDM